MYALKKIILALCFTQFLLYGCSENNQTITESDNNIDVTFQQVNLFDQVLLNINEKNEQVEENTSYAIPETETVNLQLVDEEKTWTVSLSMLENQGMIDLSNYVFRLNDIKEVISQYAIEHTRAMALKDMTQWTIVTDQLIESSQSLYINETLYEGQIKEVVIDLDSLTMDAIDTLQVQATLQLNERYFLTEEVESPHAGHSHGEEDTHADELSLKEYTIQFELKKEEQWKVNRIDFLKQVEPVKNSVVIPIDAPFYTPTEEAIHLAKYYLDYQQISIFLEEFFTEYTKALNFKNEDYIRDYTTKETIFHKEINEQSTVSLVELNHLLVTKIEQIENNQYRCQVEITFVENNEEKMKTYDFNVLKQENGHFIISQ